MRSSTTPFARLLHLFSPPPSALAAKLSLLPFPTDSEKANEHSDHPEKTTKKSRCSRPSHSHSHSLHSFRLFAHLAQTTICTATAGKENPFFSLTASSLFSCAYGSRS
ncbi:hypothetical protein BDR07DRAFT_1438711 [Suillus spraguei]|nr:hypothetical protein BDR07DRAFT_1438711 [Suillus spraguei]